MALDATLKGTSSNSYVTVAEANAYFADCLGASAWNSLSDEILNVSSATISATYSTLDDVTEITISGIVAPSVGLAAGEEIQVTTDVAGANGVQYITRVPSTTSLQYVVSGNQSAVSAISYLDRSGVGDKASSLIMATRYLDQLIFRGEPTTTNQALSFPRRFLPDPDAASSYVALELRLRSDYYDQDTIPDRVKFATYELAFRLLSDTELLGDPGVRAYQSVEIDGVLKVVFNSNTLSRPLDRNVMNYIGPLLETGSGIGAKLRR